MSTRTCIVWFAVMVTACLAYASLPRVQATIHDYGIMTVLSPEEVSRTPETTSGVSRRAHAKVTTTTNMIPAKIGIRFGFVYSVQGLPKGETVIFEKIVKHPVIVKPNGERAEGFRFEEHHRVDAQGTVVNFTGYGFDHPYELATGEWTFELRYKGQRLAIKTFRVYTLGVSPRP